MKKVILSSTILLENGSFQAKSISLDEALVWLDDTVDNFCGHQTVKLLGLEPDAGRRQCDGYDEALCLSAKSRLEFGREYSLEEIQEVGVNFTLISKVPNIQDIVNLEAKLPSGLQDRNAARKMLDELGELDQALELHDMLGAYTEAADAVYYAAKHIEYVAWVCNLTVPEVMRCAQAKYALRAQPGNPKNDTAERDACRHVLGK